MLDAVYLWLMSMQEEILMDMIRSGRSQEILSLVTQNLTDERFLDLENQYNVGVGKEHFVQILVGYLTGFGPIDPLLANTGISEIMVNGHDSIYVEVDGRIIETGLKFYNEEHLYYVVQKIAQKAGRKVDHYLPLCDARLSDGSRANIVVSPLTVKGIALTIRKFVANKLSMEDFVEGGTLNRKMATFLEKAVQAGLNIVVCGGAGSGKTTLLNNLSASIPEEERVITIEDAAELSLHQRHVVTLETANTNIQGGMFNTRMLVVNAMRMRPDRIIIGEVRGGEAFDMLQAMQTGHKGVMGTFHANDPVDAISRLETMALLNGLNIPLPVIRSQIVSAVDLIVYLKRFRDGSRKIISIVEVVSADNGVVATQELFGFRQTGADPVMGTFYSTNTRPKCYQKFVLSGIAL